MCWIHGAIGQLGYQPLRLPEDERADYIKPEFLKKADRTWTLDWLPKFRLRNFGSAVALRDRHAPAAKRKTARAVPAGITVLLYKNLPEFKAVPNSANYSGFSTTSVSSGTGSSG